MGRWSRWLPAAALALATVGSTAASSPEGHDAHRLREATTFVVDGFAGTWVELDDEVVLRPRKPDGSAPEVDVDGGGRGVVGFNLQRVDDFNDRWTFHRGTAGAAGLSYSHAITIDEEAGVVRTDVLEPGRYRLSAFSTEAPATITLALPLRAGTTDLTPHLEPTAGGFSLEPGAMVAPGAHVPGVLAEPRVPSVNSYEAGVSFSSRNRVVSATGAWIASTATSNHTFWQCLYDLGSDRPSVRGVPDPGCQYASQLYGYGAVRPMVAGQGVVHLDEAFPAVGGDFLVGQSIEFTGAPASVGHYHVWIDTQLQR